MHSRDTGTTCGFQMLVGGKGRLGHEGCKEKEGTSGGAPGGKRRSHDGRGALQAHSEVSGDFSACFGLAVGVGRTVSTRSHTEPQERGTERLQSQSGECDIPLPTGYSPVSISSKKQNMCSYR